MDAFYEPLGDDRFRSTPHTAGPWSADSQHLGPPSALLARQLERMAPAASALARITVEVLGPVPVAELTVRSWVARPGRSVQLSHAELSADGRPVATAAAWWIATSDSTEVAAGLPAPLPPIDSATPGAVPDGWSSGYLQAMEWLSLKGGIGSPGPATVWIRQRVALVDGESPTGLQRLMAVADSGNGVSNRLDPRECGGPRSRRRSRCRRRERLCGSRSGRRRRIGGSVAGVEAGGVTAPESAQRCWAGGRIGRRDPAAVSR